MTAGTRAAAAPDAPVARSTPGHPRIAHRPALDGLRGLAVVGVLLFHGGHLKGGFLGVDLFFVLSGYLITALLLVEVRDTGTIHLGSFWLRRARRLLPAIFAVLLAIAVYGRLVADPLQWPSIRDDGIATLLYVANWHTILAGAVYGAATVGRSPFEHTWSLAIEEQFYLVWPLVVLGVTRIRRSPWLVLYASVAVAALGTLLLVGLSFTDVSRNSLYLGTHTRIAAIGFGGIVASWQACHEKRTPSVARMQALDTLALLAVLLLAVAWSTVGLGDAILYRGVLSLCGIGVAIVIAAVTQPRAGLVAQLFSVAPLRGLGFISYGLYLWHWPIFLLLDQQRTGLHGWALFTVQCVASIAVAIVSYEWIEKPVRRSDWDVPTVAKRSAVAAVVVLLALVAMSIGAPTDGLADAPSAPVLTRADGQAPVLATYGDSVAYLLAKEGLAPKAKDLGVSLLSVGRLGCEPLGGIYPARYPNGSPVASTSWTNCIDTLPTYPANLSARPDVALVLFGGAAWDARIDGTWRHPCDAPYQRRYRERVAEVVDSARTSGAKAVVLARPAPIVAARVESATGLDDGAARRDCLWKAVEPLLGRSDVRAVDLQEVTCGDDASCDRSGTDRAVRSDGIHYRGAGALAMADWLVPEVRKVTGG